MITRKSKKRQKRNPRINKIIGQILEYSIDITTPALLFSATSFILMSYTSRFLALANVIRKLCEEYEAKPDENLLFQIKILDKRINLIRLSQIVCIANLLTGVLSMLFFYQKNQEIAIFFFGVSMFLMIVSLIFAIWEINISADALKIQIKQTLKK